MPSMDYDSPARLQGLLLSNSRSLRLCCSKASSRGRASYAVTLPQASPGRTGGSMP